MEGEGGRLKQHLQPGKNLTHERTQAKERKDTNMATTMIGHGTFTSNRGNESRIKLEAFSLLVAERFPDSVSCDAGSGETWFYRDRESMIRDENNMDQNAGVVAMWAPVSPEDISSSDIEEALIMSGEEGISILREGLNADRFSAERRNAQKFTLKLWQDYADMED